MTKQDDELVARLRELAELKYQYHTIHAPECMRHAADRIAAQAQEIAELRACVKAADAMRFNDSGLPSWAKDAYDAARSQLNPKDAP